MKGIRSFFLVLAVFAVALAGCKNPDPDEPIPNQTPVAGDYTIGNLTQTEGNVTAVTIKPKAGKSSGAITIYYEGRSGTNYAKSRTLPKAADIYTVTFNVAAADGWNAASGLKAGTLVIDVAKQNPVADDYEIGNLMQTAGRVTAVTITPKEGKSQGEITIYYGRSTVLPQTAGTYTVTFDVAATSGWNAASGLNAGTLTIEAATPITSVSISIDAPVRDVVPLTEATVNTDNCTAGIVTWSPADSPFKGGVVYTASVTLTATSGYTFNGLTTAHINGQTATMININNTGAAVILSYVFPATSVKPVTNIAIKTQPTKLSYTHGDKLDLTGLEVTLTYDDATTEDVVAANFTAKNITANPAQNDSLTHVTHNGKPVTITYGSLTPLDTDNLTVNPKAITFTVDTIAAQTYTGSTITPAVTVKDGVTTLTLATDYTVSYSNNINAGTATVGVTGVGNYAGSTGSATFAIYKVITFTVDAIAAQTYTGGAITPAVTVKDGATTLTLNTDYTVSYSNNINVGNNATVTITGAGNYKGSSGSRTFTINKAVGASVNAPTLNTKTVNSITVNAVSQPGTGQTIEYARNTNNTAPSTGWQASTTFSGLNGGTIYYIFARSAGNNNYEAGAASSSLLVDTPDNISFNVTFKGPTEKVISITKTITNNLSQSNGGTITLGISETFTNYEWFVGGTKVGTGKNITLNAGNSAFVLGNNWITVVVYDNAAPWSGEFTVLVNN